MEEWAPRNLHTSSVGLFFLLDSAVICAKSTDKRDDGIFLIFKLRMKMSFLLLKIVVYSWTNEGNNWRQRLSLMMCFYILACSFCCYLWKKIARLLEFRNSLPFDCQCQGDGIAAPAVLRNLKRLLHWLRKYEHPTEFDKQFMRVAADENAAYVTVRRTAPLHRCWNTVRGLGSQSVCYSGPVALEPLFWHE